MSLQVFLQAQLRGSERFLVTSSSTQDNYAELAGRCGWLSLICEVLPRALLADMKLSRMLLGSSGGEQFLLVLTDDSLTAANEFLTRAAAALAEISDGTLELVWASTENLGAWPVARKRLDEALLKRTSAALKAAAIDVFAPFDRGQTEDKSEYFKDFGRKLITATSVGWSAERPAHLECEGGTHSWPLKDQGSPDEDSITYPRRYATTETNELAEPAALGKAAEGAARWAILRGDVDHFDLRLRRADTVEEHIQLSILFKEFFAGELSLLCTLPEFWRKVSILYRGGDDFAVIGAWDALVPLARELERVFEKFTSQNLGTLAGVEAKSISMALAVAPDTDAPVTGVFETAGQQLRAAKAAESGTFYLFGRTLEWKRLTDAEELKNGLVRLVKQYHYPSSYLQDLAAVYREAYSAQATRRAKAIRVDKPWRTYMRLSRVIPTARRRDLNQLRTSLITNLIGKKTANLKLRPSGRVGLEWARLATENE
jgi:CRISPR-associated protein Csm1